MACDEFTRIQDNVWAIAKTIWSLRAIERYGSARMGDQAFSAWKALPPSSGPSTPSRPWREVLGVPPDLDPEGQLLLAKARYKTLQAQWHPDKMRDDDDRAQAVDKMAEINGAMARAKEELA